MRKQLLHHRTKGILKLTYELDLASKARYPMSNYVYEPNQDTLDLLQEIGMLGCRPVDTPMEEGLKLQLEPNQIFVDRNRY